MVSTDRKQSDTDGPVLPLILLTGGDAVSAVAFMNEKSYRKSIEQGYLWCVDEKTGRVLPYGEKTYFDAVTRGENWYAARLSHGGITADDRSESGTVEKPQPRRDGGDSGAAETDVAILTELALLLKQRKAQLPEGSYTSYLFRQGPDKIRKKTGEEAVELILAREKSEIVSETADLLYHILVLFEALDLDISEVYAELRKRHE